MADPVVVSLPEWEWTKVATGITAGNFYKLVDKEDSLKLYYYYTYRVTTDPVPSIPVIGTIPEEAVRIFDKNIRFEVTYNASSDVYMMCINNDDDADDDTGKIRADL